MSNTGRAIVEEIATLASLALFVGMVAIWFVFLGQPGVLFIDRNKSVNGW